MHQQHYEGKYKNAAFLPPWAKRKKYDLTFLNLENQERLVDVS